MALHPGSMRSASSDHYCQYFIILSSSCLPNYCWRLFILSQIRTRNLPRCCLNSGILVHYCSYLHCLHLFNFSNFLWSDYRNVLLCALLACRRPSQIAKWRLRGSVIFVVCALVDSSLLLAQDKREKVPPS